MTGPRENLIGQKFGNLIVIGLIDNHENHKKWLCRCNCKNQTITKCRSWDLKRGDVRSCGCLHAAAIFVGDKFGALTIISVCKEIIGEEEGRYWNCKCDCGNDFITHSQVLTKGKSPSCGCVDLNRRQIQTRENSKNQIKYHPSISSAITRFNVGYNDGDLDFQTFYSVSQLNCYYCGAAPNNKYNIIRKNSPSRELGIFIYNGLDRIDSLQNHNKNNILPCCFSCNSFKRKMSYFEFGKQIINIYNNFIRIKNGKNNFILADDYFNLIKEEINFYNSLPVLKTNIIFPRIKQLKLIWSCNYNDGDISFEEFCALSQLNCYYCNSFPNNKGSKFKGEWSKEYGTIYYSGLDRIDSSMPHNLKNCLPCCKICNFMKSNSAIEEFAQKIMLLFNNFIMTKKYCEIPYLEIPMLEIPKPIV